MKFLALIASACAAAALVACGGASSAESLAEFMRRDLPEIAPPEGPPPARLVVRDLEEGDGRPVEPPDHVAVRYVGAAYETGETFDRRTTPFYVQLGKGRVMPGFDRAIAGMRLGGRREAIVPPRLTFDEAGEGETLVYVIDLLGFESGAEYERRLETSEPAPFP